MQTCANFCFARSAHEVLRDDSKLLAPEETPEEVLREREQRAAALAAVQGKLKAAGDAAGVDHWALPHSSGRCESV
jgi:hypothetical protein